MAKEKANKAFLLTPERLNTLSDGVFAIVMTILILDIKIERSLDSPAASELFRKLWGIVPRIEVYVISFLILGLFWISHHSQFHYIKKIDLNLLWINIIFLMFVSILPFSTDIAGEFADHKLSALIFSFNLLLVNVILYINWRYATYKHLLVDPNLNKEIISLYFKMNLLTSVVLVIAILLFNFEVPLSYAIYMVVPFIHWYYIKKIMAS